MARDFFWFTLGFTLDQPKAVLEEFELDMGQCRESFRRQLSRRPSHQDVPWPSWTFQRLGIPDIQFRAIGAYEERNVSSTPTCATERAQKLGAPKIQSDRNDSLDPEGISLAHGPEKNSTLQSNPLARYKIRAWRTGCLYTSGCARSRRGSIQYLSQPRTSRISRPERRSGKRQGKKLTLNTSCWYIGNLWNHPKSNQKEPGVLPV